MKASRIITATALALSLGAPAMAGQLKQTWTLEGQQVNTSTGSTDMSTTYYDGAFATKKECLAALNARIAPPAAGPQPPPCLPNQVQPPACSMSATFLSCHQGVYGVEE